MEKKLETIQNDNSALEFSYILLKEAMKTQKGLTEEQKQEKLEILKSIELQEIENEKLFNISQGRCPDCYGKLIRGKKDKKNDYKRKWDCKDCKETHYA